MADKTNSEEEVLGEQEFVASRRDNFCCFEEVIRVLNDQFITPALEILVTLTIRVITDDDSLIRNLNSYIIRFTPKNCYV